MTDGANGAVKVTRAPEEIEVPQLRTTLKGTLEPRTIGRPVVADLTLGVNLMVDMDNVAVTSIVGIKIFPHKLGEESFHLGEVYVLGAPLGGDFAYAGSLALFRLDYPEDRYDLKYDEEVARRVRDLVFPGPKAYRGA